LRCLTYTSRDLVQFGVTVSLITYIVHDSVTSKEIASNSLFIGVVVYTVWTSVVRNSALQGVLRGMMFAGSVVILHSLFVKSIGLFLVTAGIDVNRNMRIYFEEGIFITMVMWPLYQFLRLIASIFFATGTGWLVASLVLVGQRLSKRVQEKNHE